MTEGPTPQQAVEQAPQPPAKAVRSASTTASSTEMVTYEGRPRHIFYHFLIAFPDIAYSPKVKGAMDEECVTPKEFKASLEELYSNGYVLVDINSTFKVEGVGKNETVKPIPVQVPKGKKPLIMSIDDMNYDPRKLHWGMVHKIVLDREGALASYTKLPDGKEVVSRDNEVISILEAFISAHPDFSVRGARATLALTGFPGILGYRTQLGSKSRTEEIKAVGPIIQKLKTQGWNFASHGYGHRHSNEIDYAAFASDTKRWRDEVGTLLGPTKIYIYPFGQPVDPSGTKYQLLHAYGFRVFCGVASDTRWKNYRDGIYMTRQAVCGTSLVRFPQWLKALFDAGKVLDREDRKMRS